MPVVAETATVVLRLSAFVHEEGGVWVAGCRSLDVYSQGDSSDEAKANLREAVELWIESCVERDTLADALRELGWFRIPPGTPPPADGDLVLEFTVSQEEDPQDYGDRFPLEVEVPAYQAALFSETFAGVSG